VSFCIIYRTYKGSFSLDSPQTPVLEYYYFFIFSYFSRSIAGLHYYYYYKPTSSMLLFKMHAFIFRSFLTNTSFLSKMSPGTTRQSCLRGTRYYRVLLCACVCMYRFVVLFIVLPVSSVLFTCFIMGSSSCEGVILNRNYLCTTSHEI
jgi:hypothetical protein